MNKLFLFFPVILLIVSCNQPIPISQGELKQIFIDIIKDDSIVGPYFIVDSIDVADQKSLSEENIIYKISFSDVVKNNTWNAEIFDIVYCGDVGPVKTEDIGPPKTESLGHFPMQFYGNDFILGTQRLFLS